MDGRSSWDDPLNPLPSRWESCEIPDLDAVPQPYELIKSRSLMPQEMALAHAGNLLVRDRVKRIFETLMPEACAFYPTVFTGTTEVTPWSLAVPQRQVSVAKVKPSVPRCPACGEHRSSHPGSQGVGGVVYQTDSTFDLFKSSTRGSSEPGWKPWITRDVELTCRQGF